VDEDRTSKPFAGKKIYKRVSTLSNGRSHAVKKEERILEARPLRFEQQPEIAP
jgi:hypothetical protein